MSDLRLSVSKTKTFLDCAAKYKYAYIEKLPKKDWEHHNFGKFLHKILEDFHLEYINGNTDPFNITMTKVFKNAFSEYKEKITKEVKKDAYEIVKKYLLLISKNENSIKNITAVEKSFELKVSENLILNGMIDRIQFDDDNTWHVCDYKTTKNKKYLKEDWFQLLTYAYVLCSQDTSIKKVRGSYILLRHDFEYITKDFFIDEILEIKDKYENYAKNILMEVDYKPKPTPLCSYCDFSDVCPESYRFVNKMFKTGKTSW